jgi:hypothetical protein
LPRTGGNVWVHERQAGQKNGSRRSACGSGTVIAARWARLSPPYANCLLFYLYLGHRSRYPFRPIEAHAALHGAAMRCLESWRPGNWRTNVCPSPCADLSIPHARSLCSLVRDLRPLIPAHGDRRVHGRLDGSTNGAARPLSPFADMPPTMPNPESETQKNSRWVRSNSFGAALGGLPPRGPCSPPRWLQTVAVLASYRLLASTMAVMPARTAGGNIDQPSKRLICPI